MMVRVRSSSQCAKTEKEISGGAEQIVLCPSFKSKGERSLREFAYNLFPQDSGK